ncbi:MAG: hypothetical protein HY824_08280 [Acidobacteria bacterium]|nr:hypothetical protein [Acidobacteriota bacterium]
MRSLRRLWSFLVLAAFCAAAADTSAQWTKIPQTGVPRAADGKPNLSAPAPRLPDGRPDLSGVWAAPGGRYVQNVAADLKPGEVPYQPWAKALVDSRADGSHGREDPDANCLAPGVPRIDYAPPPWKIINGNGEVAILYEAMNLWRQIYMDGREPVRDPNPSWLGYSVGRWDGDALVVETTGFNGKAWLDQQGKPTTEALRVTERFHRRDFGHMDIQITLDDTKAYTRPWTVTVPFTLQPTAELLEFICENNRDLENLPGERLR